MEMKKGKRSSIFKKMLISISIPVILVLVCAGALISFRVRTTVIGLTKEELAADSRASANEVSEFFTKYLSGAVQAAASQQMEAYIKSVSGGQRLNTVSGYRDAKISLDKMAAADSENIMAAWISDFDTSQTTQSDGFTTEPGWDVTSRPWYKVKETKAPLLTEPYVDASTGNVIVTAAAPVTDNNTGEVIGAVGYDIALTQMTDSIAQQKIGKNGFLILCTDSGRIVFHPDSQYIQKNVSETDWPAQVVQAFLNGYTGDMDYTMGGERYSGCMNRVESSGWYVLSAMPVEETMASYYSAIGVILVIFGIGLVVLIVIIFIISKSISSPLKELASAADQIAMGQLHVDIKVKTKDETGLVADAMNKTVLRLRDYINYIDEISAVLSQIARKDLVFELKYDYAGEFSRIRESLLQIKDTLTGTLDQITRTSTEVSYGSNHVASGAQELSQGSIEQSASVERLAENINDISQQVKQNAEDSEEADRLMKQVAEELTESNEKMQELKTAMEKINSSSGEIGKIIKTIEDIAFQTNILALNAAVEAARAGEAGKGFAVVADEVRNLASKSSQAAKETTELIEHSVDAVESGTRFAEESAFSMLGIVETAGKTTDAIQRIAQASAGQAAAVTEIADGIDRITAVVQTNSATAEESAAASEQLSAQAQAMERMVKEFNLES